MPEHVSPFFLFFFYFRTITQVSASTAYCSDIPSASFKYCPYLLKNHSELSFFPISLASLRNIFALSLGSEHDTWHHFPKILLNFIDFHSFECHHCLSDSYTQLCIHSNHFIQFQFWPAVTVNTRDLNLVKLKLVSSQALLPLITSSLPQLKSIN